MPNDDVYANLLKMRQTVVEALAQMDALRRVGEKALLQLDTMVAELDPDGDR